MCVLWLLMDDKLLRLLLTAYVLFMLSYLSLACLFCIEVNHNNALISACQPESDTLTFVKPFNHTKSQPADPWCKVLCRTLPSFPRHRLHSRLHRLDYAPRSG